MQVIAHMRRIHKLIAAAALGFVGVVVVMMLWMTGDRGESRTIQAMPADDRALLFDRSYAAARAICDQTRDKDAFRARCAGMSEFVLEFPECDDACRAFASQYAPREPSR